MKIKEMPNAKIGVFTSTDGLRFQYQGIALEEPFHLSYPQVFRHQAPQVRRARRNMYLKPMCRF